MRHGKYPFVIGFLIVPVTLYVVFVVSPYLQAFYISLTNWRGYAPPKYVGLDNYHRLFADDTFWKAVRHNGLMLLTLPLITIATHAAATQTTGTHAARFQKPATSRTPHPSPPTSQSASTRACSTGNRSRYDPICSGPAYVSPEYWTL